MAEKNIHVRKAWFVTWHRNWDYWTLQLVQKFWLWTYINSLYDSLTETDLQIWVSTKMLVLRSIIKDQSYNVKVNEPCNQPRSFILLKTNEAILKLILSICFNSKSFKSWTFCKITSYWNCWTRTGSRRKFKALIYLTGPCIDPENLFYLWW